MFENLQLYDNTRISDARRCLRFFFFRHVMHWKVAGSLETALAFGGGWHAAMDVLWRGVADGLSRREVLDRAYEAFVAYWVEANMPHPDEIDMELAKRLSPRTPLIARERLDAYMEKRGRTIREVEILEIERPFAVPLDPNDDRLFYVGRIDKIIKPKSTRVRGIEHKTTTSMRLSGSDQKISGDYLNSYSPNSQVDGYAYAMHLMFPEYRVDVWVDAALVHKVGEDFQFIPVERQMDQLDSWLSDTRWWIDLIEREKNRLAQMDGPEEKHMVSFPKNTNSCFDFNRPCPYLDLCKARANPLTYPNPPAGYKIEKWDPLEHLGTPKELVEG